MIIRSERRVFGLFSGDQLEFIESEKAMNLFEDFC